MKLKLIALSLVTVLATQFAPAQTPTTDNAHPGGPSTGGNNTTGTPPPANGTAASAATNAAAAIQSSQGGSTINQPSAVPPLTRSVSLDNSGTAASTPDAPKSDQQIKSNIRQTLATEISSVAGESYSGFSGTLPITCDVQDGVATLMGSVGALEQKEKIELIVQRVPGVARVENLLQVSDNSASTAALGGNTNRLSPTSTRTGTNSPISSQSSTNQQHLPQSQNPR